MAKLSFLAGFGAGYVLGSRAGRERYEQIRRSWSQMRDRTPPVDEVAARVRDVGQAAMEQVGSAAKTVKEQVGPDSSA